MATGVPVSFPVIQPNLVRGLYPEVSTTGALANQGDLLMLSGLSGAFANAPQFTGQCTFEEVHHDEMEIVDHPIQQGANITDHVFKKPAELNLKIGWGGIQVVRSGLVPSEAPSQLYINQLASIYNQLLISQSLGTLFTVVTGKRQYTQMAIKLIITQSDQENENILGVQLHMKQLFIAFVNPTSVPAAQYAQANPQVTNPNSQNGRTSLTPAPNFDNVAYVSWLNNG